MEDLLELAKKIQTNMADEAEAIIGYTEQEEMLRKVAESHPEIDTSEIEAITDELIADELNHQQKLSALYSKITGILPKEV